jgi:hypothetical protein
MAASEVQRTYAQLASRSSTVKIRMGKVLEEAFFRCTTQTRGSGRILCAFD